MAKRDIGAEIVAGLKEFRDKPEKLKRYELEPADVKGIRQKFGMTQQQFADLLMISVRFVRCRSGNRENVSRMAHPTRYYGSWRRSRRL